MKRALTGVGSVLPAGSVALTRKTCLPRSSFFSFLGELQVRHFDPSSRHSKLEPRSDELNAIRTVAFFVFFGGAFVIRVFGAVRSGSASTVTPHGESAVMNAGSASGHQGRRSTATVEGAMSTLLFQ